ncbi:MAG TPA: anthranilate phosphoribosyltransferase [Bacteroidetes bacterium]|nr:anthranilate phosphoribosyltransferase [Bacteroidota bacterium]
MKKILNHLFEHRKLTRDESREVLTNIAGGAYNHSQIAAFLTVYLMRSISVEELAGFRAALLDLCIKVDLDGMPAIDLCGTGGDGKNTFNISTLASFVTAGAGAKVAKHGNYGVSSVCGSSNVMENLGYTFKNNPDQLRKEIDEAGICFLHAPLFHPAMKNVAPVRRALGIKTFFNMLGPLVNPAFPSAQFTGVFSLELGRIYRYLLQETDRKFTVVHTLGGYDEVSLTDRTAHLTNDGEGMLTPADFGGPVAPESIYGGDTVEEASKLFTQILSGNGTEQQNRVVVANAALALQTYGTAESLDDCIAAAQESLISGRAMGVLKKLINLN